MQEMEAGPGYYALWPTGALSELWGVLADAFYSQVRLMAEADESAWTIVHTGPGPQHVLHENLMRIPGPRGTSAALAHLSN